MVRDTKLWNFHLVLNLHPKVVHRLLKVLQNIMFKRRLSCSAGVLQ
uniref:Uncharacterized protein n=1 Tax=Anguilla anguilla TaxID=7936 RepID=A0A0E9UK23_ANGAN